MYQVVINILEAFITIWSAYVPISDAVTEFKDDVAEIDETKEKQQQLLHGYTVNKRNKKRDMATKGIIICKKVRAYAADTGDTILFGKMKISFTKLFNKKDTESTGFAELIYESANAMSAADKTKYEITAGELTDFRDAIDTFVNVPSPAQAKAIRKQLTEAIPGLFTKTTTVLKEKVDNLMGNFQLSNPDFYAQYFNARRIFESHRHTTLEGAATNKVTGADLPNVQVLITSSTGSFQEMTNVQGKYKKQIEPEINYNVKFIIPGYEPKEFSNINLNRGEHERLNVQMNPLP